MCTIYFYLFTTKLESNTIGIKLYITDQTILYVDFVEPFVLKLEVRADCCIYIQLLPTSHLPVLSLSIILLEED